MLCYCCSLLLPTDTAGQDFQTGVILPYFAREHRSNFIYVPILMDRERENAECFYMTLHSPLGESYDPEIRVWTPSRALGWIQSEINSMLMINKSCWYVFKFGTCVLKLIGCEETQLQSTIVGSEVRMADSCRVALCHAAVDYVFYCST